jgi:hypothetical protein
MSEITPVTGWIDPILISRGWVCKKVGKPETTVVVPAAAEYLRKVRRVIFFFIGKPPYI